MAEQFTFTNDESLNVGVIYCIGRNYKSHAKEMGSEISDEPVVFIKPATAFTITGSKVQIPKYSSMMHHEVELVVVIERDCNNVEPDEAMDYVAGYGVGIDFTLRDVQSKAKASGLPWTTSKSFFGSAPVSTIIPISEIEDINNCKIELKRNGETVQSEFTKKMHRSPAELISYISHVFRLRKGDCIFTGTPKGVGLVEKGDKLEASLNERAFLEIEIE